MPCFHPLTAYRTETGDVVFVERKAGGSVRTLQLPCGRCIGCRLERSRQWAVRCMHEAKLYDENCFITLTYDEQHAPHDLSLRYTDFQKFMKRLRRRFFSRKIRFYMCGEYGENFGRPHYHACLFNLDFPDKLYFKKAGDSILYTSKILDECWTHGFSLIGSLSFESAAYVARYCTKKVTGPAAENHYKVIDKTTGEIYDRTPEFGHMSLKPGIGGPWLDRFMSDVYPRGEVIVNNRKAKPPRYYDKMFMRKDSDDSYARMMHMREQRAVARGNENSQERLAVREQVTAARLKTLSRNL